ncbi:MAG: hypothetical protein RLZZ171_1197 [Cyanobacteriota bacterium]|jgi:Protein of unknown function (DUF2793)
MPSTPLFNIPLLDTSTFSVYESNNHYRILEALHNPRVVSIVNTPPSNPVLGSWYQVGLAPTGDFIGHQGEVATRLSDYWHFLDPLTSTVSFYYRNLLYNPASFILSNTFVSLQTSAPDSTVSITAYYKTIAIAADHSGCSLNLTSQPAFKGELAISNTGTFAIAVNLFGTNVNFNLPALSSRVFLSDGVTVF